MVLALRKQRYFAGRVRQDIAWLGCSLSTGRTRPHVRAGLEVGERAVARCVMGSKDEAAGPTCQRPHSESFGAAGESDKGVLGLYRITLFELLPVRSPQGTGYDPN